MAEEKKHPKSSGMSRRDYDRRRRNLLRQREYRFKPLIKNEPNRPKILAEGDSWFIYKRGGIVGRLIDKRKYAVLRIASNGETVENILKGKEYLEKLKEFRFDCFLFSGGGNDVLGEELPGLLKKRSQASDITDIFTPEWGQTLIRLRKQYKNVIRAVRETRKRCKIIAHGYDYPHPTGRGTKVLFVFNIAGPWLKNVFADKGIIKKVERDFVIKELVDKFNDMLAKLERDQIIAELQGGEPRNFYYLDLRNTVGNDWADEIHPDSKGFRRIADKYQAFIDSL